MLKSSKDKPVVRCCKIAGMTGTIRIGGNAIVFPLDHPLRSNKNAVHTSTILSIERTDGEITGFETANTLYKITEVLGEEFLSF